MRSCMRCSCSISGGSRRRRWARGTMIKSMTGFASLTRDDESVALSVTIRAVNHRFLDVQLRTPSSLASIEPRLRAIVQQRVARGRVGVSVSLQSRKPPVVDVEVNEAVIEGLAAALDRARERGIVTGALTPGDVLRFPQAVTLRDRQESDDSETALASAAEGALTEAVEQLDGMRTSEGQHLRAELDSRRSQLADLFERAAAAAAAGSTALRARLAEKV